MRQDATGTLIARRVRDPRIVIGIIYASGSIYLTNKTGLANVPGTAVQGCVVDVSTTSQTLSPDERRTTIGTLNFRAVDLGGAITADVRDQLLNNDRGVRRREVRVFTGDTDDFNDYARVETYVVDGVKLNHLTYEFSCSDRSREQRVDIFDQAKTRLTSSISATDATITVTDTSKFQMLAHTAAFSDAPSSTVGYFKLGQSDEIVRYTGKTSTTFTGCTRGVFNTAAQAVAVTATTEDQKPEVEEYVYLEMPGPQLDYALKTGKIKGTANVLPDAWHMGIDEANVAGAEYDAIGTDLYDPADVTAGLVLRFVGLTKTDGKRFCESELYVPMGTYAPISSFGVIGIRRLAALVPDAAAVAQLDASNIISHGDITHALAKVRNQVVVAWNFNGEKFTRTNVFYNATSVGDGDTGHGPTVPLDLELHGVNVARHTPTTLRRIANYFFERYGAPPIELSVKVSRAMNHLEIGDVVRVVLTGVRDFASTSYLSRSFEIQSRRINWATGELQLTLFGSTQRTLPDAGTGTGAVLADAWYNATGTALSSVLTIASNHVTANGTLTGGTDLRTSVFYHLADLTIDATKVVTITGNVELRIRGALTVNGKIDGKGGGIAAIADPNTVSSNFVLPSSDVTRATLGSTRSSAGIREYTSGGSGRYYALQQQTLLGLPSMPLLALAVDGSGNLLGLPADIRGTPGIYGLPVVDGNGQMTDTIVRIKGGAGGASGAGLLIVSRGTLAFGASGQIDLSGNDGTGPSGTVSVAGHALYPGGGGGGAPGALYWIGDGDDVVSPDFAAALVVNHGATTRSGTPIQFVPDTDGYPTEPWTGFDPGIGAADMFEAAHVVQFVPSGKSGATDDDAVPAPTGLAAATDSVGVTWSWEPGPIDKSELTELWVATSNDRTGSVLVSRRKSSSAFLASASAITRYGWVRNFKTGAGWSAWQPSSSTGGVVAGYGGATGTDGIGSWTPVLTNVSLSGNTFTKTDGTGYTAQVYSAEKFASLTVTTSGPTTTNLGVMYGLNIDPTTDTIYTSIDYCFAYQDNGHLGIYENGTSIADLGTYSASEATSIVYTGHMVKYYRGTTNVRVVGTYGKQFALDTSFHGAGVVLPNLTVTPGGPLPPDGRKWIAAADGKPAGWRGVEGVADRARLSFDSAGRVSISGAGNTAFGLPAIPVSATQTYTLRVRHISSGASSTGLYIRANEKSSALVAGTTHVGSPTGIAEPVVDARTGFVEIATANGPMPGTTITEDLYSYTPTAGTLFMSLSFYNWGATGVAYAVEDVSLIRLGSTTNLLETTEVIDPALGWTPVLSQGMLRSGKTFTKVAPGAASTWDTAFSSAEKYGACQVTWQPASAAAEIMVGLNSDPTTDNSYSSIDFAIDCVLSGTATVYESGTAITSLGSYVAGDVFSVQCDGVKVRYLKNGVVLYTSAGTPAKALYADSSFYTLGGVLNNVDFGPIAAGLIDLTNQTQGALAVGQHNIAARGWNNTTAFSVTDADTIAWAAGTFTSADGSSYSIAGGNTGNMSARTYIYLDIGVSTTAFQTTTTAATAVGSGKVMVATAINGTTEARYSVFGGAGGQNIDGSDVVTGTITTNEIAANTIVAGDIAAGTITANEIASSLTWTNELILSSTGKIRKAKTSASDTTKGIWLGDDGASGDDLHVGDATSYIWFDYSAALITLAGDVRIINSNNTFTPAAFTGFSANPSGMVFSYIDLGDYITLWVSTASTGTSNSVQFSIDDWPAALRPSALRVCWAAVTDNGTGRSGMLILANSATATFNMYNGGFTASGTKGVLEFVTTYRK